MKTLYLILLTTLLSCSEDRTITNFQDCNDYSDNYKLYNGEELECKFYYSLTEYNNQEYIELNSLCADLVRPFVINQYCEDICEKAPYDKNSACGKYLSGREYIEVLLIEK